MRIVVNHLTRMSPGYICVAGVEPESLRHIRPTLPHRLERSLLLGYGGLFDIGAVVDIGDAVDEGIAPEVEDHLFFRTEASFVKMATADEFWALLDKVSKRRLVEIFGPDLRQNGATCSVDDGCGSASLGCLIPHQRPQLFVDNYGGVRLRFTDGEFTVSSSVTDLRLYQSDQTTPRYDVIQNVATRIARGTPLILSVGLTRPWRKPGDSEDRHWFQVNGVNLRDCPIWTLEVDKDDVPRDGIDDIPF